MNCSPLSSYALLARGFILESMSNMKVEQAPRHYLSSSQTRSGVQVQFGSDAGTEGI